MKGRPQDLYATLGVARDADAATIKRAYKKLARKHHPDLNPGDSEAEEQFKAISAAFEVLGDAEKKKRYDEFGFEGLETGFDAEQAQAYRNWRRRAEATGAYQRAPRDFDWTGGRGAQDIDIEEFLRGMTGRGQRATRGADVSAELTISLRDSVLGVERELSFEQPDAAGHQPVSLRVKVPAGVEDGQRIRLRGQGLPGPLGGPAGDLLIRIHVQPHPSIKREGRDLQLELPVTVGEAMLGAKVEVPTFHGNITLTIPPGSQTGTKLRVRAKGVPATPKAAAGDLYVRLSVRVPQPGADPAAAQRAAGELALLYTEDVRAELRL